MRDDQPDQPLPGDLVWIRQQQWRVRSAHAGDGLTRLDVVSWPAARARTFLLPCERWARNAARVRPVSANRALAWLAICTSRVSPAYTPSSIITTRAELLAYQLEPALAILAGTRRLLIADAVGLGKTVQAALIIAEILRRSSDAHILVLAPSGLLAQWRDELQDRFGVVAHIADADSFLRIRSDALYLSNPWHTPGVWLASPDYVKQPHVIDAMPATPFDLVVIDEAHAMAGHSQRHAAINTIARKARHVVMLTATPHNGDATRFCRLMDLGGTGSRRDALLTFRRTRSTPARRVRRLNVNPGAALSQLLTAVDAFEQAGRSGSTGDALPLICAVFRKRALSSVEALTSSLHRRLSVVSNDADEEQESPWSQPGLVFDDEESVGGDTDLMPGDEWALLKGLTGLSTAREITWLQRLLAAAQRAMASEAGDQKLARVVTLLSRSRAPVVIFTEYRDSLIALSAALRDCRRIAVLHGGLSISDQRHALHTFLYGEADTLLATDVASQGLNLQHRSRWVLHFDLPWTPMRFEQRVGRVDRIGQTQAVHVTVVGVRHQADEEVRRRMAARRDASEAASLPSCTRWSRAAHGLARLFARQRALAARWRGPDPLTMPRARGIVSTLSRLGLPTTVPVTLVEIPIVTNTGEVLERSLGWQCGAPHCDEDGAELVVRRARAIEARARRRASRLHAAQTLEQAGLRQPGLFDRGDRSEAPRTETPAEITAHVGPPRPLLILERRR